MILVNWPSSVESMSCVLLLWLRQLTRGCGCTIVGKIALVWGYGTLRYGFRVCNLLVLVGGNVGVCEHACSVCVSCVTCPSLSQADDAFHSKLRVLCMRQCVCVCVCV